MRLPADKAAWRARLLAARRMLTADQLTAATAALREQLRPRLATAGRVAAYIPVGTEPGSVALLDDLRGQGTFVLLPVSLDNGELDWAPYTGRGGLVAGRLGLLEPTGPRLGIGALTEADVALVPALAADQAGTRLGRGAGYYDRALARLRPGVPVVALLHDGELVGRLPADPWDRPVTAACAPQLGWTDLPVMSHHVD